MRRISKLHLLSIGLPCQESHDFSRLQVCGTTVALFTQPLEKLRTASGLSSLFDNTNDALKEVIKVNSNLAIQALIASKPEDVQRIEKLARLVPQTETKRHLQQAGWILNGLVMYGQTAFTSAIRCLEEGKVDPVPYLVKFKPTANEIVARETILARAHTKGKSEALLENLVPTQLIEMVGNKMLAMPQFPRTLANMPPLSEAHVLQYVEGIYLCLLLLWELQVFHCDIKPANLFLNARGRVFLGDFGSSQFAADQQPFTTSLYVPVELDHLSGAALDAGNLLSTVAELLGWWNHSTTFMDMPSALSVRTIRPQVQAMKNARLKAIMLDLIAKVPLPFQVKHRQKFLQVEPATN